MQLPSVVRVSQILFDQLVAPGHSAADQIGMAGQILRPRVHDEINAEFRGMLVDGRAEGGIDHAQQLVLFGHGDGFLEIDHAQGGIGG